MLSRYDGTTVRCIHNVTSGTQIRQYVVLVDIPIQIEPVPIQIVDIPIQIEDIPIQIELV